MWASSGLGGRNELVQCDARGRRRLLFRVDLCGLCSRERSDVRRPVAGETTGATDSEVEAALAAAGFPASYCSALASLHQKYPNWQFVPVQTGLDWNTVVSNESLVGRNLIQNSVNDARKSTDSQAYNWETNKWYGFDGQAGVGVSGIYRILHRSQKFS